MRLFRFLLLNFALVALLSGRAVAASFENLPIPPPSSITQIKPSRPIFELVPKLAATDITFGINVRVNSNLATLTSPQVEPSVASNPTDPRQLVAVFVDSLDDVVTFDFAPGVARSTDGGQTWFAPAGGATVPNPPGFIWGNRDLATHLAAGDSAVAWGLGDAVYYSTLGFHDKSSPPNNDCSSGGIYVYRSDDGGDTWQLPANAAAIPNTQTVHRDKEYIAADANSLSPFAGNLYMAWDDDVYIGCPQSFSVNFLKRDISFSVSSDGGATWSTPIILATGCLIAPVPAVAANGDLYVVWFDCNIGIRQMVRKSTDGGLSFGPAVAAASGLTAPPNPLVGSEFRVNAAFPSIATDPTNADNVYVTWSSDNGPSQTDVFVSRSLNGGTTWSPTPVRVNDDPLGNPRDQFFPWIAVSADGTVRAMWGDDRLDLVNPGGKLYDIFVAESTDAGGSFGPNIRVTTTSSNPDFDGFGGTFIGDYFGLSASGVPVWDDMRLENHDIFGAPAISLDEPLILDIPEVLEVGDSFAIEGANFTDGSVVNFFVSTAEGPVNFGPLTPSSQTPTQLTVGVPGTVSPGQGYAAMEVINTDEGFAQSNQKQAFLLGSAAAGIPSIWSINGIELSPTSLDPGIALAHVETVVVQGDAVMIAGSGFDTGSGVAVDIFCDCAGGKVGPFFLAPGNSGLTADAITFTVPGSGGDKPATGPGSIVVSNAGGDGQYTKKSNGVSVPIGDSVTIDSIVQEGDVVRVMGTGFSTLSVINLFNAQGGGTVNLGGLNPDGTAKIPLTVIDSMEFTFELPVSAQVGPAFVQVLNPPFIPFSSSGGDPDGAFEILPVP